MSGQLKNGLLLAAILLLAIIPLMTVKRPVVAPAGEQADLFTGTDTQAAGVIQRLAPGYQPWFDSLFQSPSKETESLLFALQAALGAGIIGYYAGYVRGKKVKMSPNVVDRAH